MNEGTYTINFDMTNYNHIFQTLAAVVPEDAVEFVSSETARLAEECALQLSRRASQKGGLNRDIRGVFRPMPRKVFTESKMNGSRGMKWLYAAPNALAGVNESLYHADESAEEMMRYFYKSKGAMPKKAWEEIGLIDVKHRATTFRGRIPKHQHVMELRRHVVPRSSYRAFFRLIKSKFGRLEASFAKTAQLLRAGSVRLRAYITRHLSDSTLPNITELAGLSNKAAPHITFGSYAPGVGQFDLIIGNAIEIRSFKMAQRFHLIVSGYSADVARSISPRRRAREIGAIE